jgi:hypothetical protein
LESVCLGTPYGGWTDLGGVENGWWSIVLTGVFCAHTFFIFS